MSFWLRFARTARISSLSPAETAPGEAVVEGRVAAEHTLSVPGSSTRPILIDLTVESYKTGDRGRGRPMWIPTEGRQELLPFYVDDDTGRIFVAADAATTNVSGGWREVGPVGPSERVRYVATFIAPGDRVRVRGEVARDPDGRPGELLLRGTQDRPLQVLFRRKGQP